MENYKFLYKQAAKLLDRYQDEIVPCLRAELDAAVRCIEAIQQARDFKRPAYVVDDALREWRERKKDG